MLLLHTLLQHQIIRSFESSFFVAYVEIAGDEQALCYMDNGYSTKWRILQRIDSRANAQQWKFPPTSTMDDYNSENEAASHNLLDYCIEIASFYDSHLKLSSSMRYDVMHRIGQSQWTKMYVFTSMLYSALNDAYKAIDFVFVPFTRLVAISFFCIILFPSLRLHFVLLRVHPSCTHLNIFLHYACSTMLIP